MYSDEAQKNQVCILVDLQGDQWHISVIAVVVSLINSFDLFCVSLVAHIK